MRDLSGESELQHVLNASTHPEETSTTTELTGIASVMRLRRALALNYAVSAITLLVLAGCTVANACDTLRRCRRTNDAAWRQLSEARQFSDGLHRGWNAAPKSPIGLRNRASKFEAICWRRPYVDWPQSVAGRE